MSSYQVVKKQSPFLYQEIAESLRRRILAGEWQPGERLPPVREMARQWNCTPGTVSRAYRQLAQENLVSGHRGGGTQVVAGALSAERPFWAWANLVNRAEGFLLEALGQGHTPAQAQAALSVAVARWHELQGRPLPGPAPFASGVELRFAGSHDLTIELLGASLAEAEPAVKLHTAYVGSLGGLMALARDEADVAGTHLWDAEEDAYNVPFVRRLFPGRRVALLTVAHRSLGLIVPPGNPQGLTGVQDLTRAEVRLVNRQAGSGTRVWLDAQLARLGVAPQDVAGYEREELTHLAVAQAVAQGEATVGLGIHAAAAAWGLGFVPLTRERYELACTARGWRSEAVRALVETVRSRRFREAVTALGGYDTAQTGQERWVG